MVERPTKETSGDGISVHVSEGMVPKRWEGVVTWVWGSRPYCAHSHEATRDERWLSAPGPQPEGQCLYVWL